MYMSCTYVVRALNLLIWFVISLRFDHWFAVIILVVFILCGCFQYHYAVITSALCGCRSGTQTSVALANRGGSRASRGLERHRDDSDKRELLTEMGLLSPRNG